MEKSAGKGRWSERALMLIVGRSALWWWGSDDCGCNLCLVTAVLPPSAKLAYHSQTTHHLHLNSHVKPPDHAMFPCNHVCKRPPLKSPPLTETSKNDFWHVADTLEHSFHLLSLSSLSIFSSLHNAIACLVTFLSLFEYLILRHIDIDLIFQSSRRQDADAAICRQCNQALGLGSPFHIDRVQRPPDQL